jgi:FAD/FMN-containing dehydrogenase
MRRKPFLQHFDSFFFPLDRVRNWNRMYGKRGFVQYQCVFPLAGGAEGLKLLLEELAASRRSGFLAVLKLFGPGNSGHLSFPIEGYTLSLDLPLTDPELFVFLDRLDEIVLRFNGRVYLAKDARMRPEVFWAMYPRLNEWRAIKAAVDPRNRFQSDLSQRLQLDSGATSNRQG